MFFHDEALYCGVFQGAGSFWDCCCFFHSDAKRLVSSSFFFTPGKKGRVERVSFDLMTEECETRRGRRSLYALLLLMHFLYVPQLDDRCAGYVGDS